MAEIRRAVDMVDGQRSVAIKLFPAHLDADRLHLEAYARECQILQRLDHPNIVRILDGGKDDDGRRYLVLEWLERTLAEHIASRPIDGWDTFFDEIGRPVLGALSYAYARSVVHRDLKPQNILFSPEGVLKVADFGISKLINLVAPGLTVAGFRSQPYSPPEPDDGRFTATRDVYGFGVVALACLGAAALASYDDVYKALAEFDGPPDVARVLESALSREPTLRPQNIIELRTLLERIQSDREDHFVAASQSERRRCYIKMTRNVEDRRRLALNQTASDVRQTVLADLNEICGIKRHVSEAADERTIQLTFYAAQYMYRGVVDPTTKAFVILESVSPWQPSWLEFQRESAWGPDVQFTLVAGHPPADGVGATGWLVEGVAEHEARYAEQLRSAQADALFRTWASIIHAKSDIEQRRASAISYDGFERDGRRLRFRVPGGVTGDELLGQPRLIELPEHRVLVGEIDAVGRDYVVLWTEDEIPEGLPKRGRIQLDTRAERQAINRQRQALDAIRFRRAARPELREMLVEPERVLPPGDPGQVEFLADRLDESKQEAVRKALGADSFLVVEGPPGTGKTRFITELILQTLRRNPRSRVLLTSQTHVALDNALERLREQSPATKLVRIGHRDDDRISDGVSDLLLENRVDVWLRQVQARSEKFLKAHASELGVDHNEIALGIAAERLRVALEGLEAVERQRVDVESAVQSLERQEAAQVATEQGDAVHETKEAMRETGETARMLEIESKRAAERVKEARRALSMLPDLGTQLAALGAHELVEWEQAFRDQSEATQRMHRLVTLAEEWYLRFGRSRDFFAALITDSEVIAGTCLGFAGVRGMNSVDFDLCIVDEASKAAVTELLVPLSRSRRWVLVGDRRQLPPFVEDALQDQSLLEGHNLKKEDLRSTLLEALADRLPSGCVTRLLHQHRMIRAIGDLVSHCFYDGELKSVREGEPGWLAPALPKPVTWFSTTRLAKRREIRDRDSYKNLAEVVQVSHVLRQLNFMARLRKTRLSVAILSGYGSQREELRRALDACQVDLESLTVECNTVDAFQGREADIAIYSVTRCNDKGEIGFLREHRRLNVALSRARSGLVVVGCVAFLRSVRGFNPWNKVIDYIESHPNDCVIQEVQE